MKEIHLKSGIIDLSPVIDLQAAATALLARTVPSLSMLLIVQFQLRFHEIIQKLSNKFSLFLKLARATFFCFIFSPTSQSLPAKRLKKFKQHQHLGLLSVQRERILVEGVNCVSTELEHLSSWVGTKSRGEAGMGWEGVTYSRHSDKVEGPQAKENIACWSK